MINENQKTEFDRNGSGTDSFLFVKREIDKMVTRRLVVAYSRQGDRNLFNCSKKIKGGKKETRS